jgi:hypothetical protein
VSNTVCIVLTRTNKMAHLNVSTVTLSKHVLHCFLMHLSYDVIAIMPSPQLVLLLTGFLVTIDMKTHLERILNETPDYTFFKVYGCAYWPHLHAYNNHKLEFRSKKCVFLGYCSLHKGYKYLHVPSSRVYISRDAFSMRMLFPMQTYAHFPYTANCYGVLFTFK